MVRKLAGAVQARTDFPSAHCKLAAVGDRASTALALRSLCTAELGPEPRQAMANEVRRGWSREPFDAGRLRLEFVHRQFVVQPRLLLPGVAWVKRRGIGRRRPPPLLTGRLTVRPGPAAAGAPAAQKPDLEADSLGQLMSDLLVLPQQWLPWDLSLINNR